MTDTKTDTKPKYYCTFTGYAEWSNGSELMRAGEVFEGHPMMVVERPELFSTEPVPASEALNAGPQQDLCWTCRSYFTPKPGGGQVQRYCNKECRRAREVELARAIRIVNRRTLPSLPRGTDKLTAHIDELNTQIGLVRKLIYNLGGWIESREDRTTDEIMLDPPNQAELVGRAKQKYGEIFRAIQDAQVTRGSDAQAEVTIDEAKARREARDGTSKEEKLKAEFWERYAALVEGRN
jgi:hypothetical protein